MIRLKEGVKPYGIKPELMLAITVAESVFTDYGYDTTITSLSDGTHSRGSKHYVGYACDLRTRHLTEEHKMAIRQDLAMALGRDYDVVLEETHIHVEYDPDD